MKSRWMELLGMVLIGDGILNVVQPSRHSALWNCGPQFYKKSARTLQTHPGAARGIGVAFVALGIWLSRCAVQASSNTGVAKD
ncbi:MAG: hypothetical protein JWM04_36 [Verrucomicrobiales bacterium]|nr:hypothetical protein [Verrucomicrobiales bacterium]